MKSITLRKIQTSTHPDTKKIFWNLFAATRGASNRIKIMNHLKNRPSNPNQISNDLGVEYKGVRHHLNALEENQLVEKFGSIGTTTYFVAPLFEQNQEVFEEITTKVGIQ